MDHTAIQKIIENSAANQTNQFIDRINLPAIQLHKDWNLKDIQEYMPQPQRFSGRFITHGIDEFVYYVNDNTISDDDIDNSACFVDPENMTAKNIFDFGTHESPLHRSNTAVLSMAETPEYEAVIKINEVPKTQRDMAEWMEDYMDFITFYKPDENGVMQIIPHQKCIQAIRSIDIEEIRKTGQEVQNLSETRSAMERIEAKSVNPLPQIISFQCNPYENFGMRDFRCRMSITTERGLNIKLTIVRLETHKLEIANEFKHRLSEGLHKAARVYIGQF